MVSFNPNDGDEEEDSHGQKFGWCATSDECYACTGRIIINLEECQVEEASDAYIDEDETITFCESCLQSMMHPAIAGISYDPVEAFMWQRYLIVALHPDSMN